MTFVVTISMISDLKYSNLKLIWALFFGNNRKTVPKMTLTGREEKNRRNFHILISYRSLHLFISQSFYYPEHVGLKIGTNDTPRYIVMETHYDNPDQRDGTYNSMSLRDYLGSDDVTKLAV